MITSTDRWPLSTGEATTGKRLHSDLDNLVDSHARTALAKLGFLGLPTLKLQNPIFVYEMKGIDRHIYTRLAEFINRQSPPEIWPTFDAVEKYLNANLFYKKLNEEKSRTNSNLLEVLRSAGNPRLIQLVEYTPDELARLINGLSEEAYAKLRDEVEDLRNIAADIAPFISRMKKS